MSHRATNWAVTVKGIPASAKVVLWHLADRHNKDTGQCNPSQDRLAADCEISRSSLNNQLSLLESAGLIERKQQVDSQSKRRKSTVYILNFEVTSPLNVESRVQNLDKEAMSKFRPEPCPNSGQSHVQNLDINPVREPGREPEETHPNPPDGRELDMNELISDIRNLSSKFDCDNAKTFHDSVCSALLEAGYHVEREYEIRDRGDGRRGFIDIAVMDGATVFCGIECDRATARHKSAKKLKEVSNGLILLREKSGGSAEFLGVKVLHVGVNVLKNMQARNVVKFGVSEGAIKILKGKK